MKNPLMALALAVIWATGASAYSFEIGVSGGTEAGYRWGLDPAIPNSPYLRAGPQIQLALCLGPGKVTMTAESMIGTDYGITGSLGYEGETFLTDWFSLEGGLAIQGGWFTTGSFFYWDKEPSQFVYAGFEPMGRANLLLFEGGLVLSVATGASVRWLQNTAVVAAVTVFPTVGLRF